MTYSTLVSFRTSATAINESLFHSCCRRSSSKFATTMTDGSLVRQMPKIKRGCEVNYDTFDRGKAHLQVKTLHSCFEIKYLGWCISCCELNNVRRRATERRRPSNVCRAIWCSFRRCYYTRQQPSSVRGKACGGRQPGRQGREERGRGRWLCCSV